MIRHRVLLLNASHNDVRLLKALKQHNCYVITTGNRPDLPGHAMADEYVYGDYTDKEAMLKVAEEKNVDAVCPCCNDFGVLTAAYVSEALGFSGQDSYETALTIHNKDRFKAFAAQLGSIRTPRYIAFNRLADALDWVSGQNKYPRIVKPVDLSAGNGIGKANDAFELKQCIHAAFEKSRVGRVIVEDYVTGSQHGFCTFLREQKVVALCTNNEYSFINPYRVEVDTFPAEKWQDTKDALVDQIERIAQKLQLTDGIFHLQYILDGDGQAHILECMRRVLGNLYSVPAEGLGAGFNWDEWEVRAKCNLGLAGMPAHVPQTGYWAYRALIARENGTFNRVNVAESIKPYVYQTYMLQPAGYRIVNHASDPLGFLFMHFHSENVMKQAMIVQYDDIHIETV